jgi:hypothetical protein
MRGIAKHFRPRVIAGFLIAPLVPGIVILLLSILAMIAERPTLDELFDNLHDKYVWRFVGVATVSAYAGALLFGIPAYRFLLQRPPVHLVRFGACGCIIGIVTGAVMLIVMGAVKDLTIANVLAYFLHPFHILVLFVDTISGFIAGILLWLIARPDRASDGTGA